MNLTNSVCCSTVISFIQIMKITVSLSQFSWFNHLNTIILEESNLIISNSLFYMLTNATNGTALTILNSNSMLVKTKLFNITSIKFGGAIYYYNRFNSNR